jgi:hypothetical protein
LQSWEEWRKIFYLSAGIYVLGAVLYCCLASGEIQLWACHAADGHGLAASLAEKDAAGINPNYCENADEDELEQDSAKRGKSAKSSDVVAGPSEPLAHAGHQYGTVDKK